MGDLGQPIPIDYDGMIEKEVDDLVEGKSAIDTLSPELRAYLIKYAIDMEHRHAKRCMCYALIPLLMGVILIIIGMSDPTTFTVKILGNEFEFTDVPVGFAFSIIGFLIILLTKPKINLSKTKNS